MEPHGALTFRNPKVQHLRRLIGRRSARTEHAQFTFEGTTLLREALDSSLDVDAVFVDETSGASPAVDELVAGRCEIFTLAAGVLERVADTSTPPGVIAVAPRPAATIEPLLHEPGGWVVVLDGVGDPGNAGTIVRTVEAFGGRGVVFAGSSVDPFGPKTVRAAAGSAFRLPLVEATSATGTIGRLTGAGYLGVVTVSRGGDAPSDVDLTGPLALVLGSEAHGVGSDVLALDLRKVSIPMAGGVESLNVASAAAVLGYERARQRDAAAPSR